MDLQDIDIEILTLKHEWHQLKIENKEQTSKIAEQAEIINKITIENQELTSKLFLLRDKLNINSSNSGIPTSKEIYKIEKNKKSRSGLKAGGQIGQKPRGYRFKTPDEVVQVSPQEERCDCGGELRLSEKFQRYQKIELPVIKPVVTEYILQCSGCVICGKKYKAKLEDYKLLGRNAESIISGLGGFFNNSKRDIQSILSQIFNLDISLGLISNSESRVSEKLENRYNELVTTAENSEYLHLDESSANKKGKLNWCWIAANKFVTVFKLADSRGRKALEKFLPEYEGKVITDRYAVYNVYDNQKRQVCLAHLRRDFKRFMHSSRESLSTVGKSLIESIDLVFAIHNDYRCKKMDKAVYLKEIREIKKKMLDYLKSVSTIEECRQAQRVANNILKAFDMMWLFVEDEQIEPTNNFAERQIKHHVKYRKNSLFTWSDRGDRFIERAKSIYATAKLQNLNPFGVIHALI